MASMEELSEHIIAVAHKNSKPITNLHLQKTMFFIFGRMVSYYGANNSLVINTYNIPFRRWSYGPVVEDIYFSYNHFGGREIKLPSDKTNNEHDEYNSFNEDIVKLLDIDPFKLVEFSHKLPSWARYKKDIEQRKMVPPYEIADFEKEFR